MDTNKIGIRYAKALFLFAHEKGILDEVKKDIELIYASLKEIKEINKFLESPVVQVSKKKATVKKIFDTKITSNTINFLELIIENNREKHIESICRDFIAFYKEQKHIKTVLITSAIPLHKDTKNKITDILKKQLKSEIELSERVNERIVGGFVLHIDDIQFDASISTKLNKIKHELTHTKVH